MIVNGKNDMIKELNSGASKSSLNKCSDKNNNSKVFDETLSRKLNRNSYDSDDSKANSNISKNSNDDKKDIDNNSSEEKILKLEEDLNNISKDVSEGGEDEKQNQDINKVIENLISLINGLMSMKNSNAGEDSVTSQNDITSITGVAVDAKNAINQSVDLKNMIKLLTDMTDGTEKIDINTIKSMIDSLKSTVKNEVNSLKSSDLVDLKANIISEIKLGLVKPQNDEIKVKVDGQENIAVNKSDVELDDVQAPISNEKTNQDNTFGDKDGNRKGLTPANDKTIKKEDNFLDSLINEKDKTAINRFMPVSGHRVNINDVSTETVGETIPVVNKTNIVEGIVKSVKFMQINDMKELTVSLNPKDLGSMLIKISMENGRLNAKIIADKKETFELINSNLADVKNALGNVNDKVQQVSVNIQFGDATAYEQFKEGRGFQQNERGQHTQSNNTSFEENTSEDIEANDINETGAVNMLA